MRIVGCIGWTRSGSADDQRSGRRKPTEALGKRACLSVVLAIRAVGTYLMLPRDPGRPALPLSMIRRGVHEKAMQKRLKSKFNVGVFPRANHFQRCCLLALCVQLCTEDSCVVVVGRFSRRSMCAAVNQHLHPLDPLPNVHYTVASLLIHPIFV